MENKSKLIALTVTASMFLGSTGYLYYENNQIEELNTRQRTELSALSEIKNKLHREMNGMKAELEKYRGQNRTLDKLVSEARKDIKYKEQKIQKLITVNASLKHVQTEVNELRSLNQKYLSRLKELEEKLLVVGRENIDLKFDNSLLNDRLSELEERNQFLERKISMASVLQVENILVAGEKKLKNGKFAKSKLRKADRFLMTFDVVENKVTAPGQKEIFVSVTGQDGKMLQNAQSGNFMNADNNMEMPYTQKFMVDYMNEKQKLVVPVEVTSSDLGKGTYNVEFFCEGHFCGLKKLKVK